VIRINLLPPEIGQKRKDEERWRWVILGAIVTVVLLAGVFAVLQFQVSQKQSEVAAVKQQAESLKQSATRFQVFQDKQAELANRQTVAGTALAGRMDWAKVCGEIGLILPADLFLMRIGATEPKAAVTGSQPAPAVAGKLTMDGKALDFPEDAPDLGFKSVAKLLVRLAGLDGVGNVWLTQSAKPAFVVGTEGSTVSASTDPYVTFGVSADLSTPPSANASATGVPAPPKP
jgi:Tfp pilus assembly protein PilN